jgi:hypothetical protein
VVCLATGASWKKMTLALNLISAVTCRDNNRLQRADWEQPMR